MDGLDDVDRLDGLDSLDGTGGVVPIPRTIAGVVASEAESLASLCNGLACSPEIGCPLEDVFPKGSAGNFFGSLLVSSGRIGDAGGDGASNSDWGSVLGIPVSLRMMSARRVSSIACINKARACPS